MNLAEESSKTIEAVVPRLYVNLPSGVPADVTLADDDSPVDQCLAGDLVVMYAFDVVSKMLEQEDKPLSRVFLRRNGTQWEPYTGFAD